ELADALLSPPCDDDLVGRAPAGAQQAREQGLADLPRAEDRDRPAHAESLGASASRYGARVISSRKTKRASSTAGYARIASCVALIATEAASPIGYPYAPVEIAGNATVRSPRDAASSIARRWHDASCSSSPAVP